MKGGMPPGMENPDAVGLVVLGAEPVDTGSVDVAVVVAVDCAPGTAAMYWIEHSAF